MDQFGGVRCPTHVGVGFLADVVRQRSLAPLRRAGAPAPATRCWRPAERSRALPSARWQRWVSQRQARSASRTRQRPRLRGCRSAWSPAVRSHPAYTEEAAAATATSVVVMVAMGTSGGCGCGGGRAAAECDQRAVFESGMMTWRWADSRSPTGRSTPGRWLPESCRPTWGLPRTSRASRR